MTRTTTPSRWLLLALSLLVLGAATPAHAGPPAHAGGPSQAGPPAHAGGPSQAGPPAHAGGTRTPGGPVDPSLMAPGRVQHEDWVPSTESGCRSGNSRCLTNLIREMERTYDRMGCEHQSVFSLLYLRTTEGIRDAILDGHFDEPRLLTHQTYVFGRYYLDPYRAWRQGRTDAVPEAWRIAFDAEADKRVSVVGNMMLGINAHVNHDLAFVLAALGPVAPDGSSRKADHDAVNTVLAATRGVVVPEIAADLDPSILDVAPAPDVVPEWREAAWHNAQALIAAETQQEWDTVARGIEDHAAAMAEVFVEAFELSDDAREARDAHCAAARG